MELEVYKKSDFYEDYIDSQKEYYERENADAYFAERLADKDKEIDEIKTEHHKERHEYIEMVAQLRRENAELKSEISRKEAVGQRWFERCMEARTENIRLKRALWLARAYRAEARKNYWYARSCHEGDERLWSIDGSAVKYIGCIKRTNFDWLKVWSEVELKCLKKAEEYK